MADDTHIDKAPAGLHQVEKHSLKMIADGEGNRATGETYCIAHHVSVAEGKRTLFIASLRYYDVFTKAEGTWLFAERKLIVDWTDTRPMNP